MNTTRRTLLKFSLTALALPLRARAQQANVRVVDAGGSKVVICETGAGLVLADSGAPAYANALMKQLSGKVHTLFNTHWHPEQCGANEQIGMSGAAIVAHQKTWQRLSTQYYLPHEERYVDPLPAQALPTVKFADKGTLEIGGETIDYGALVLPHTDADIYVHFRNANVLAVGGAVTPPDIDPELDWYGGGWIGGRAHSMDTLLAIADDDTLIVPASGRALTKAELQAERDMTHELYQRLNKLIRSGCSASCMAQEGALEGLGRTWQNPERFLYAAYKGLWAHHYNLAPDIL
jgi:glyoxylase-like metal-dependent hydrolase (beta-lactamase superfamily II)